MSELSFQAQVKARSNHQIEWDSDSDFRGEELIVRTPDDFTINALIIDGHVVVEGRVPAIAFAEFALPPARQFVPTSGKLFLLLVSNEADEDRAFEAVVRGKGH